MKKYILVLLIAMCSLTVTAQVLQGRILDAQSQNPIALAAIYFNGTFVGTSSNEDGNFELDVTKYTRLRR